MQLPESFLDTMRALLKDEYADYLRSFEEESHYGIRVNTKKISVDEFVNIAPFALTPIPWTTNGFYVKKTGEITRHPYYFAGLYYVQEPSAMLPAARLPVESSDRVLDVCAAPGGKATELGSKIGEDGLLVANDISNSRAKGLLKNLELFGIGNMLVCSESPDKLGDYFKEYFDKILVDAPCSGEGMFRKEPSMRKTYEQRGPASYTAIQRDILAAAADMLKPGGMLLYSTCTFSLEENEKVIEWFLDEHRDFHLRDMPVCPGFLTGFPEMTEENNTELKKCVRLFPHKIKGEGHFAALMCRDFSGEQDKSRAARKAVKSINLVERPKCWVKFAEKYLTEKGSFLNYRFMCLREKLYAVPVNAGIPGNVRYLRTGIYLGDVIRETRFEPSQALAMYMTPAACRNVFSMKADDQRVTRYLKGETLQITAKEENDLDDGWVLICVDGYSLGWGKLVNGTIRNKYYAGWRMS